MFLDVETFCLPLPTFKGIGALLHNAFTISETLGKFDNRDGQLHAFIIIVLRGQSCRLLYQWSSFVVVPNCLHLATSASQTYGRLHALPFGLRARTCEKK